MRELAAKIGNMTGPEVADYCKVFADRLGGYPKGVQIKELLIISAYASTINDPQPGLFGALVKLFDGDDPTADDRRITVIVQGSKWTPN